MKNKNIAHLKIPKIWIHLIILVFLIVNITQIPVSVFAQSDTMENLPPVANPHLDMTKHENTNSVVVLAKAHFIGEDSYDPNPEDNAYLTYYWEFGDGSTSNLTSPTHIYNRIGDYTVSLTVGDQNLSDTATLRILVISEGNHEPVAKIVTTSTKDEYGNNHANVNEPILFNSTGSFDPDGFELLYEWDFGDGVKKTGENIIHQYSNDGTYVVLLTVTDEDGLTSKDKVEIIVGTGESVSKEDEDDSGSDGIFELGYMFIGLIAVIIILLVIVWMYLGYLRKKTLSQVERVMSDSEKTRGLKTTPHRPPQPEFARRKTQIRETRSRQARLDRLSSSQETVRKSVLQKKMQEERKKVDDDMKKELEDMGIDI